MTTISEASRVLKVTRQRLLRAIDAGKLNPLRVSNRLLINLDDAKLLFAPIPTDTVDMEQLAENTGLSMREIRRGMAEGWLPWLQDGKRKRFDVEAVYKAIEARMLGTDKT